MAFLFGGCYLYDIFIVCSTGESALLGPAHALCYSLPSSA